LRLASPGSSDRSFTGDWFGTYPKGYIETYGFSICLELPSGSAFQEKTEKNVWSMIVRRYRL